MENRLALIPLLLLGFAGSAHAFLDETDVEELCTSVGQSVRATTCADCHTGASNNEEDLTALGEIAEEADADNGDDEDNLLAIAEFCPGDDMPVNDNDLDGDGYAGDLDCDESDEAINSGAAEICDDGIDNDCDMLIDDVDPDCNITGDPVDLLQNQVMHLFEELEELREELEEHLEHSHDHDHDHEYDHDDEQESDN